MIAPLSAAEKRSFLLYILVILITSACSFFGTAGLALAALTVGLFGAFRLTYFFEGHIKNIPPFLSLPARLLFGLVEKEQGYKKNILHRLIQKDIIIWFMIGLLYMGWIIFCGLYVIPHSDIAQIFEKDLPIIPALSYLNIYHTIEGIIWLSLIGLIIFLAFTYAQSEIILKFSFFFFIPLFGILFLFNLWHSYFIFSLPPLYTTLIQGIGAGKSDLIFTNQPDIFLYPPTEIFMRYIESGLIGIILFFGLFLVPTAAFIRKISYPKTSLFYPLCGFAILLCLFINDSFLIDPPILRPLQIVGLTLIGLAWGQKKLDKSP